MRKLYFLVPGTGGKFACGGLWAELKTLDLAQQICSAEVVTYRQREQKVLFLDDLLQQLSAQNVSPSAIFVISWGFDVAKLAARLKRQHVIYHAHSAGYGFSLPSHIPIITVSRSTLGYWGQKAPHSLIYYLPNQISDEFANHNRDRDIDVLVQARKSSTYLLQDLIPALQQQCRVEVVQSYVEDLPGLFNRAKVYLYDSAEYWAQQGVSEGFGLQPLEAIACGCQVFSSVNGGLSDYLDPGFNSHKIACYSQEYDVQRILKTLSAAPVVLPPDYLAEHRREAIVKRLATILDDINHFFDHQQSHGATIPPLTSTRLMQLNAQRVWGKLKKKLFR
ncbi:MAG TPA: glycosyltransferase [Coleofasciculaceae cyanobacterium]